MCRVIYTRELSKTIIHHSQADSVPGLAAVRLLFTHRMLWGLFFHVGFSCLFCWGLSDLRASIRSCKSKGWDLSVLFCLSSEGGEWRGGGEREDQIRIKKWVARWLQKLWQLGVTVWRCDHLWVSIISVVRPSNTPQCWRDELSPANHLLLSSPRHLSCPSKQGFYSQLNISTENLIRICKSLLRGECNN